MLQLAAHDPAITILPVRLVWLANRARLQDGLDLQGEEGGICIGSTGWVNNKDQFSLLDCTRELTLRSIARTNLGRGDVHPRLRSLALALEPQLPTEGLIWAS